ncbi:glycine betaine ABC transporter substrate-binding protein [Lentibacillus cibarius]|uniref:Glycine betaine ABC transporter substrate-binding protein n=1 Tax=Lentibacillus cibarius TaxID=2583219 RepID=A0A5S3QJA8_9BACI|nr:glycine betaine ABC transporter substrate-binding protein [Lentibacillus cibarius]TMN21809.1 glycine betaine ABC transporter substrate-binding protein [Lentibacillus cibarius]
MNKILLKLLSPTLLVFLLVLSGCGNINNEADKETTEKQDKTDLSEETIVFGEPSWTSAMAPTAIAKKILKEAGYQVKSKVVDQPIIFTGMKDKEIDFFMDAWLPYTEKDLWEEYRDDLTKVSTSYEEAPLGWVVPTYVEEDSIEDLKGRADKFGGSVVTMDPGAGIVKVSREVLEDEDYGLDDWELNTSSETAMIAEAKRRIDNKEPIVFTGWKPHSMFNRFDLKFLDEPKDHFKFDNIYVLSYKGIEKEHPAAYDILSKWEIDITDLEDMMAEHEESDTPFDELADNWIENHRDKVDDMLGEYK